MKRLILLSAIACITALPAFADDTPAEEADDAAHLACYHYSNLAFVLAHHRDEGQSAQEQWKTWQKIPDDDPKRAYNLARVQTVLQYVYGKGSKVDPTTTRDAFMQGCAAKNAANVAPPPAKVGTVR